MEEKNPVFTGLALSSEAHILWALSNFFLQLFVWGLATSLFLSWASTEWEGFLLFAFVTGLIGLIWGVVPLWAVLYPRRDRLKAVAGVEATLAPEGNTFPVPVGYFEGACECSRLERASARSEVHNGVEFCGRCKKASKY